MSDTPKKLIACCDGTWLNSDSGWKQPSVIPWNPLGHTATPSNVTRISRAIKALDSHGCPQIVYYQRGLGTGWTLDDQILGGALGLGLGENIREGYEFIANNYAMRDVIVLIGFSRGAFTARSIGGMICSLGLLTKEGLSFFYEVFEDWEHTGLKNYKTKASSVIPGFTMTVKPDQPSYLVEYLNELKRLGLTREVDIAAIGTWETVGALGIPSTPLLQRLGFPTALHQYKFYDTGLNNQIRHAFQALALDEARSAYVPTLWNKHPGSMTTLKQCWFPGVHSNVGGSYPGNGIGELTLAWMMSQLSVVLDFETGFIKHVWEQNETYLKQQNTPQYQGWGKGQIVDSARFPRSLIGGTTRTPGQYHVTDRSTGKPELDRPMLDTCEYVHASVRRRMEIHGRTIDKSGSTYRPQALNKWRCDAGQAIALGNATWVYEGTEKRPQIDMLPEDSLGDVEVELLNLFDVSVETNDV